MARVPKNHAEWTSRDPEDHHVYILAHLDPQGWLVGPCKIGISKNVGYRLTQIRGDERNKNIVIVANFAFWKRAHALRVEQAFHRACHSVRVRGEWFDLPVADAVVLMQRCLTAFADRVLGADEVSDIFDAYWMIGIPGEDPGLHPADFFAGAE